MLENIEAASLPCGKPLAVYIAPCRILFKLSSFTAACTVVIHTQHCPLQCFWQNRPGATFLKKWRQSLQNYIDYCIPETPVAGLYYFSDYAGLKPHIMGMISIAVGLDGNVPASRSERRSFWDMMSCQAQSHRISERVIGLFYVYL